MNLHDAELGSHENALEIGVCTRCHRPLTSVGSSGECLRCLVDFVLLPDEEQTQDMAANTLCYGHFEVCTKSDDTPIELGAGSMATTFRARDIVLDCDVALKVINRRVAEHPAARARFLREARAAAKLHHPNVASVSHYGEQDGECYYVMELVEGETLEALVQRDGPLPPALALEVAIQVANALAAAETCKVVHRDLKPSNVMIVASADPKNGYEPLRIKVIDWGLAKAVSAESAIGADYTFGGFVGTPAFASPEQFARTDETKLDTRSDIYSLGVTLWYLLCGRVPFVGSNLDDIDARRGKEPLPLEQLATAHLPASLIQLLQTMLAVDPSQRPQSARELLVELRRCQRQCQGDNGEATKPSRSLKLAGALALAAALAVGGTVWLRHPLPLIGPQDRSVAVLPFENLSPDKSDSFFAVGIQDEISADLSRIGALKVIGSSSTRSYPPEGRDLRKIGRELGVAHVLEGSVLRANGNMRITARMVDCRSDAVDWTETYQQPLENVFAVQGEITHAVASHLRGSLSDSERATLSTSPTTDLKAYDLYLRAREGPSMWGTASAARKDNERKIVLLEEAVARDPSFFLAYCELAKAHGRVAYFKAGATAEELSVDHRSLAEVALQKARRIKPNAGELHLAQAAHFFRVTKDYEQARIEADLARRSLPNNAEVEAFAARIALALGRTQNAVRASERAIVLDPRTAVHTYNLAIAYLLARSYDDYDRTMAKFIAGSPGSGIGELDVQRATAQVEARAEVDPLRAMVAAASAAKRLTENDQEYYGLLLALWDRNPDGITRQLSESRRKTFTDVGISYPKAWFEAWAAHLRGDATGVSVALAAARVEVEIALIAEPTNGRILGFLAMIDAGLGRREEAMSEAHRASELAAKSAEDAPIVACDLAVVYAWTGQPDLALTVLEEWITRPAGLATPNQPTYGDFLLNPIWDSLRSYARFSSLVERLAPKHRSKDT